VVARNLHFLIPENDMDKGDAMREPTWRELCEAIMKETDPDKLLGLVQSLNQALEARETELRYRGGGTDD